MRLGLDFGTTNSAVAVYDGEQLHPIPVDPYNDNPYVMPSLIYIDRKSRVTVGARAAEVYLQRETGRPVRWRTREAGDIALTVASFGGDPIEFTQNVNVLVDVAARGRLLQSIKTGLFNNRYMGTQVFKRWYSLDELISIILRALKEAAQRELNRPCHAVTMGRPVRFSYNPAADSRAEAVLLRAAHLAGFTDVDFKYEPVGVTYLYHHTSTERQTVLVFDFGGGTLDLTVARVGGQDAPEILATLGVLVGGDDLDRVIMESLLPYFGGGADGRLPPEMIDKLRAWQTMPELSQPRYLENIRRLRKTLDDPQPLLALETLVTRNVGFKLFKEIELVKQMLSRQDTATLRFEYDAIDITHTITRRRFNRMIASFVDEVTEGIENVLSAAQLNPADIDIVLRTGGSSLVPAFTERLSDLFGAEKQRAIDPLVSVVGGFAVAAHDYRVPQRPAPAELITGIQAQSGAEYRLNTLKVDVLCYVDRDFAVKRIPSTLDGLSMIQMVNADKDATDAPFLTFTLTQPTRVYIAYESTVKTLPDWLSGFEPANMQVELFDSFALITRVMTVYKRDFPAGQVELGGNQAKGYDGNVILNYLVILDPA